jgi:alkylation response protein AidB-like acyl-CoA dehydrogenase
MCSGSFITVVCSVIRHKVAECSRHLEATHALLEQVAYQMQQRVDDKVCSGMIAMVKVQATKTVRVE